MNKEIEWIDLSTQKIGNKNRPVSMTFYQKENENNSITITQKLGMREFLLSHVSSEKADIEPQKIPDKETLFHAVEALGLPADKLVARERDLGDLKEPVVMHAQSTMEKELIMRTVKEMQPGDELTYSLPDRRSDDREYVTKGPSVTLACVEKDKLQYLFIRGGERQETEESVPFARQVKATELLQPNGDGSFSLNYHPDGLSFRQAESYQLSDVQDVHIAKGKFNQAEIDAIRSGKSIDYTQVLQRQPIKNEKAYIAYVLKKNCPNFTHGEDRAIGTMDMEWQFGVRSNFWGKEESLSQKARAVIENADSKNKEKVLNKALWETHKAERNRLEDLSFDTARALSRAGNTDRMDAVITLSRAVKDFSSRDGEWKELGGQCRQIANKLPQGENLDIVASITKRNGKTNMLVDELKKLYPDIDKGLSKLHEKRTETVMESFYKEQQQQLQKQKGKPTAKEQVVKKNKKKTSGRSSGR